MEGIPRISYIEHFRRTEKEKNKLSSMRRTRKSVEPIIETYKDAAVNHFKEDSYIKSKLEKLAEMTKISEEELIAYFQISLERYVKSLSVADNNLKDREQYLIENQDFILKNAMLDFYNIIRIGKHNINLTKFINLLNPYQYRKLIAKFRGKFSDNDVQKTVINYKGNCDKAEVALDSILNATDRLKEEFKNKLTESIIKKVVIRHSGNYEIAKTTLSNGLNIVGRLKEKFKDWQLSGSNITMVVFYHSIDYSGAELILNNVLRVISILEEEFKGNGLSKSNIRYIVLKCGGDYNKAKTTLSNILDTIVRLKGNFEDIFSDANIQYIILRCGGNYNKAKITLNKILDTTTKLKEDFKDIFSDANIKNIVINHYGNYDKAKITLNKIKENVLNIIRALNLSEDKQTRLLKVKIKEILFKKDKDSRKKLVETIQTEIGRISYDTFDLELISITQIDGVKNIYETLKNKLNISDELLSMYLTIKYESFFVKKLIKNEGRTRNSWISLDAPTDGSKTPLVNLIEDTNAETPEEVCLKSNYVVEIQNIIKGRFNNVNIPDEKLESLADLIINLELDISEIISFVDAYYKGKQCREEEIFETLYNLVAQDFHKLHSDFFGFITHKYPVS